MNTPRILTATIAALLLAPTLHAADRFWITPTGGGFGTPGLADPDWSATDGGVGGVPAPTNADIANFTLNNTYTVTFAPAVTNTSVEVQNGTVTFDLNGFTYTLTSGTAVAVGNVSGQTGRLTVTDGTLAVDTTGDNIFIGQIANSTGFLTVTTNGVIGTAALRPDLFVGDFGVGTLNVNENGRINGNTLSIGNITSATGIMTITGPNAVVDIADDTFVGAGSLNVSNGGTLVGALTATVGAITGADATATVSGVGSSWTISSGATIGDAGDGTLTVSGGGLVSTAVLNVGLAATGAGIVTVTGAGSQLLSSGTQTIGSSGTGTLNVSSGGRVETISTAVLGSAAGSDGRATVGGAGSNWTVGSAVTIGSAGAGTLTVSGGGEFRTGSTTTLGANATGAGVLTVTGAGSVATFAGSFVVGSLGSGTLNVESGAEVITGNLTIGDPAGTPIGTLNLDGGSLFVGGTFTRSGVLNFRNGLLRLAGDFQANPSATNFVLNGATNTDLPVLELVGSSAATTNITGLFVGTNRRAQLLLREGRALSLGANGVNIGSNAGGSGIVNVESGASLTNTGTLSVGGNGTTAGGTGVLTIAGGTVDIGTLRLHSGGTIHLDGGLFAADALSTLNGAFNWTTGEVRLDAASTAVDEFLAVKLLGPAKTLRAGQTLSTPFIGGQLMEIFTGLTVDGGTLSPALLSSFGTVDLRSGSVGGSSITTNFGLVLLGGALAQFGAGGSITNNGTIRGSGQIFGALTNAASGRIDVISGERLILNTNVGSSNAGTISVIGGELLVNNALTNAASTGLISARDAILRFNSVTNNGSFAFSNGTVDVYGDITQNVGGRITISNGGIANFYDDVVIQPGAASVQATALGSIVSRAVFFGSYNGGTTGGGQAFIEGDHRPGNSPALITFGGDVVYGTFANLEMELGGTARGTQYDALNVAGNLAFNGTMTVPLISGFQPAAGNVFNLFDFGSRTGTFSTVNLPALIPGLLWSQANLYTAGEIQVALDPVFISRTWDGGGANNNWITDTNWTLDVQPLNNATADLIFTGNVRLTPSVDTPWNVHSITFNNAAGNFTITGPQGVTIGTGGIVNNDPQTQTIDAAITLSASESFNAAAGDLAISSVALAGQTLTLTGANDFTVGGASGMGTIDKNNAGRLDVSGALGTGGVTLNANTGTTNIGADETLAALNIGDGATVTVGAIPPFPAPGFDGEELLAGSSSLPVPEPGIGALLASAFTFFCLPRRASKTRSRKPKTRGH